MKDTIPFIQSRKNLFKMLDEITCQQLYDQQRIQCEHNTEIKKGMSQTSVVFANGFRNNIGIPIAVKLHHKISNRRNVYNIGREILILKELKGLDHSVPIEMFRQFKFKLNEFYETGTIMEMGGSTVVDYLRMKKKISLSVYKEILFQLLHFLYIAQSQLEFMHRDLHDENILLLETTQKFDFKCFGKEYQCVLGVQVKLIDFELSITKKNNKFQWSDGSISGISLDQTHDLQSIRTYIIRNLIGKVQFECPLQKQLHTHLSSKIGKSQCYVDWKEILTHSFFSSLLI